MLGSSPLLRDRHAMLAVALELQHRALFVRQFPQGILHSAVVNLEQYDIVYLVASNVFHEA